MTEYEKARKAYFPLAKEKCPFIDEDLQNGYYEGFCDGASMIAKRLQEQVEKMKSDVKQEQSYWNSGEMQFCILQDLLEKWKKELKQL